MSAEDRKLYNLVKKAIIEDIETGETEKVSVFQTVLPLQLMCNNPDLINKSESKLAKYLSQNHRFTHKHSTKIESLRDLLENVEGKVVIFSAFNDYGSKMLANFMID
jgi:hypothetical protein